MKTRPRWTTIGSWLLWPLTFSCAAASGTLREYAASPERLRAAVGRALKDHADVTEEGARIETGWGPERAGEEQGILLGQSYRYRVRHAVELEGAAVRVRSAVERRAAAGPRATRWERVDAAPVEEALLDAIANELEKVP